MRGFHQHFQTPRLGLVSLLLSLHLAWGCSSLHLRATDTTQANKGIHQFLGFETHPILSQSRWHCSSLMSFLLTGHINCSDTAQQPF